MRLLKKIFPGLLFIFITGCMVIQIPLQTPPFSETSGPLHSLNHAHDLFQKGKYSDAEKAFRYVIETYSLDPVAADAQVSLAYTLLYFDNPKRDETKALKALEKFLKNYPTHLRVKEVKNWISILKKLNSERMENKGLKDDLQRLIDIDIQTEKKRKETQEEAKEPLEKPNGAQ